MADASEPASVMHGLKALKERRVKNVLIRNAADGLEAVLVPVERYVELVGRELQLSHDVVVGDEGRLQPQGLGDSDVELIDPNATWPHLPQR